MPVEITPIGERRRRVGLVSQSSGTSDGMGGTTGATNTTIATVWAAINPLSARERDQAKAVQSERTHDVTIRYRSDVSETMLVAYGTRLFRITGIRDPDERKRDLVLSCVELGNEVGG